MKTFVTADHHFGHARIIELCKRPFDSVDEMNAEMVRRWNSVVGPNDEVWHLGDFAFRGGEGFFEKLNGAIHLLKGNHDGSVVTGLPWKSVRSYHELTYGMTLVVMSHYAMEDWAGYFRNSIMLHGHSHGTNRKIPRRLDVGVDVHDFTPITIERAIELAREQAEAA